MKEIVVEGPNKLEGEVKLQGSKNAMLINLTLPILTDEECVISNVPRIGDIELNVSILESLGAKAKWLGDHTVSIRCDDLTPSEIDPNLTVKTSSSKFFIPLLVRRFGEVSTGRSLGDDIGHDRGFSKFVKLMGEMGIRTRREGPRYFFYAEAIKPQSREITLPFPSFSATVGAVLANVTGNGQIKIDNIHLAPEIENALEMLNLMGARIQFTDTSIVVSAVKRLHGVNFNNLPDRNVLVTFAVASLITNGSLKIKSSELGKLKLDSFWEFLDQIKATYKIDERQLYLSPSLKNLTPINIYAYMWPYFHSDWQPLIAPLLTQVAGESTIVDDLWEDRFAYWQGMGEMGAHYEFFKPENSRFNDGKFHGVKIGGPVKLSGSKVSCPPDIRGSAALVLAALAANGQTNIVNVEQLERGYENLVSVLGGLGARIRYES